MTKKRRWSSARDSDGASRRGFGAVSGWMNWCGGKDGTQDVALRIFSKSISVSRCMRGE